MSQAQEIFTLRAGGSRLLISIPHGGTRVPASLLERFTPSARALPDTDWFVPKLYAFLDGMDVTVLTARCNRLVVDLNRPTDGEPMYPGSFNTPVCPTVLFSGEPVYRDSASLSDQEVAERVKEFWEPYHATLQSEIQRLKDLHGSCLLYEAHSIPSRVPSLFDGRLPDINIGTDRGRSCGQDLQELIEEYWQSQRKFSWISNDRFIGGYITRHYGRPGSGVHAVQIEIAQSAYLEECDLPEYDLERSADLRRCLEELVGKLLAWKPGG